MSITFQTVSALKVETTGRIDAEYWTRLPAIDTRKTSALQDVCEFIRTGPMGSALHSREYQQQGIPVLRPSNLDQLHSDTGLLVYVAESFLQERKLPVYKNEDLVLARVGDIKVGMVYGFETIVTISSNLIGLRIKKDLIDPYFLLVFLQTSHAKVQLETRSKKGSLQSFGIKEIASLRVPLVPMEQQKIIVNMIRRAIVAKLESEKLLKTIQKNFPQVSGKIISLQSSFLSTLVQTKQLKRLDAEFFWSQDRSQRNIPSIPLEEFAVFRRGIEIGRIRYRKAGKLFWRVGNISNTGFLPKSQKYLDSVLYEKLREKYETKIGELLLVKDGKPGVCMVMEDSAEGIVSEGIVRITVNKFDPYYVAACIQSTFCQEQIQQHVDGSLVPHWKMEQIKKLKIPVLSKEKQKEIGSLMKRAYERERESKELQEKAKVELEMIC